MCVLENEQLFIFETSQSGQFLNSSISQVIEVFAAYAIMVDEAISEYGDDACRSSNMQEHLISEF